MTKVKFFLICFLTFFFLEAGAQSSKQGIFVMYAPAESPVQFTSLSELNSTGTTFVRTLFNSTQKFRLHQQVRTVTALADSFADTLRMPFGGSVSSIAFDSRSNRIYYFPTFVSELRYLDLSGNTPAFTYLDNQSLNLIRTRQDAAHQISRMTIDPSGWGYALSNDGEHLIRFSATENPVITDLGSLTDHSSNSVFVKSSCTSWGGDMVMDQEGRLVLITHSGYVFKIDIPTRIATYAGQLQGLPAGFTTNGAAVTESGELLVSSSASRTLHLPHPIYKISDLISLQAEPVIAQLGEVGNISDMASSYLLGQKQPLVASNATKPAVSLLTGDAPSFTLFPNPVRQKQFNLRVASASDAGEYDMMVVDMGGRLVHTEKMLITAKTATKSITLPAQIPGGAYVLKLVDYYQRTVFSTTFVVE